MLAGTKVLGIGGDSEDATANSEASLYLPSPAKTTDASDPEITLAPDDTEGAPESTSPAESESPQREITLSASSLDVGAMEQFQLTGVYPEGEGAILAVQRFQDGQWVDFPATGSVSGEAFQIPVQTSKPGVNRFRVVDTDTRLKSAWSGSPSPAERRRRRSRAATAGWPAGCRRARAAGRRPGRRRTTRLRARRR